MDLIFWLLWSLRGQHPAHETRCFAVGKTDISPPISESIWTAVIGFLSNPGTVLIKFKAASYLSLRRRISCSNSEMCLFSSSMWSRHCLSLTACSFEMAPSTAACISSIGVLQRPWTKGATSNFSPGCCKICSVIEREDLPNTSENTSSSLRLDTVRQFWARFFSPVIIQVSLYRYLTRSLSSLMSAGGMKEGFTIPHM